MIRDRVATKYRADITCKPLSATASATLLALLAPQWVTVVTDSNPFTGNTSTTYTMYANNISTNVATKLADGTFIWGGLTFPLIQQ
jgi:hypothetical protein